MGKLALNFICKDEAHVIGKMLESCKTITDLIDSIDKMANTGAVRGIRTQSMTSGVAMETEFQMLNARLSDKADNLELCEENIWFFFCAYQGVTWDGEVEYPDSFHLQDKKNDSDVLINARKTVVDPEFQRMLDYEIMETVLGEEDLTNYLEDPMQYQNPAPVAPANLRRSRAGRWAFFSPASNPVSQTGFPVSAWANSG